VRCDRQGAALVGGGDEPKQQLSAGVVEWGEPNFVDLCRRHRSIYADLGNMPTLLFGGDRFRSADGVLGSGARDEFGMFS